MFVPGFDCDSLAKMLIFSLFKASTPKDLRSADFAACGSDCAVSKISDRFRPWQHDCGHVPSPAGSEGAKAIAGAIASNEASALKTLECNYNEMKDWVVELPNTRVLPKMQHGSGSKFKSKGCAAVGSCFRLPGF